MGAGCALSLSVVGDEPTLRQGTWKNIRQQPTKADNIRQLSDSIHQNA
jgi:hypothetical protein